MTMSVLWHTSVIFCPTMARSEPMTDTGRLPGAGTKAEGACGRGG
jgi:hypothetical protein